MFFDEGCFSISRPPQKKGDSCLFSNLEVIFSTEDLSQNQGYVETIPLTILRVHKAGESRTIVSLKRNNSFLFRFSLKIILLPSHKYLHGFFCATSQTRIRDFLKNCSSATNEGSMRASVALPNRPNKEKWVADLVADEPKEEMERTNKKMKKAARILFPFLSFPLSLFPNTS